MQDDGRIRTLRERCFARKGLAWRDTSAAAVVALRSTEAIPSWQTRKGVVVRERLGALRFALDDAELLAGRLAPAGPGEREEAAGAAKALRGYPAAGGQTGHCELDRSRIFRHGIDGMLAELATRLQDASGTAAAALDSFRQALLGLSEMIEHAALTAEALQEGADPERCRELEQIAISCRRVAHGPPATFRDAVQLLWLMDLAVMLGEQVSLVVPGHLDRTLWPFYARDRAAGRLEDPEALALLECLYILVNEAIPDGLAMSVMVGGRDPAGADVTNPLSFLCLEALRRTRMIYPTVGICWHEGTPRELTDLGVELIGLGIPNVAFFGDATIQKGLRGLGLPEVESCGYINSTCVEITPVGASNAWVASPYFSTPGILLDEVAAQAASARPAADFPAFLDAYRARLGERIAGAAAEQNRLREVRRLQGRKPLQSVFTRDCIERARDIDDGGARCNWVECSFVGLANLVDSLHVIRSEVFGQALLSFSDLQRVLEADFVGFEAVHHRFLAYPKYGNADAAVDGLFDDIIRFAAAECRRQRMAPDGSAFVPGAFCWVMHERLGSTCGATPDGRRAGTAFADGCGPAQGREHRGPTAAILSTTAWDHSPLIGGAAYNMKFPAALFRERTSREGLRDLLLTFLRRGGFETQINVVDAETLRAARREPERHRDLVVRIGGYTDYFVRLSAGMQDEVIRRTEFQDAGREG
ncbi:MAG: hypothetical protein JXR77_06235 [Lentisphaeria bacterium]|nr:hypothetical protein [Lentisphaeria bacterium]